MASLCLQGLAVALQMQLLLLLPFLQATAGLRPRCCSCWTKRAVAAGAMLCVVTTTAAAAAPLAALLVVLPHGG
jgi:hypothetical protein